jgi:AAA domain
VRLPDLPEKGDVSDWLDADLRNGNKLAEVCFDAPLWAPETKPSSWRFHSNTEAAATPWLIKNILPETGAGLVSGQWGSYKTTFALDIAGSVMKSMPFAGRYTIKRQGAVAYFAVEGIAGLASRLSAIARERGIADALPFAYRSDCPALTAADAADKLTAMVKEVSSHFNLDVAVVFVDTVISAAAYAKAGDDNDAAASQKVMSTLATVSQRTGALVLGLDHFGKVADTGTRGSSAKEGHADVVLALLADREVNGTITNTRLAIRKQRDGASGFEIPFVPKTVVVGTDPDGDEITRVVIDWEARAPQPADKDWAKSLQLLRRILMATLADAGEDVRPFGDGSMVRACDLALVKAEFQKQYVAEGADRQKADARRKAFQRAVKDAQAKALINRIGNICKHNRSRSGCVLERYRSWCCAGKEHIWVQLNQFHCRGLQLTRRRTSVARPRRKSLAC